MKQTVMVAGGAGYIGSHMVQQLLDEDYDVVVADNLSTGHQKAINPAARFYEGDTRDKQFLQQVFQKEDITAVIHMDAFSIVPESVKDPLKYFDNNVIGMIALLEAMRDQDIKYLIFSSTAAAFGNPQKTPIPDDAPKDPINPYGDSKLMMEKIMKWVDQAYGIKYVALRYFNAAGAMADGSMGEDHTPETHLIPIVLKTAIGQQATLQIYGDDYNTPDGTNVRDYVHILDLAKAHILALKYLIAGNPSDIFNLGSSTGFSVKEIVEAARKVTGKEIPAKIAPRRDGDPDILVADSSRARKILGWQPQYDNIHDIVQTAWTWKQKHPNGYND
ncbi:UDP-glucose 4-epimerase GalE [Bombilactobacillus thymidiniphilus]|uniref:UDP-glucose 4-epimerase n=1 Tax=Bombilactobacillus thymidiniphilus TaxID=2923363 RepID=A0ABY4PD48_9LACO|nr:UDP-glucose 4-epimerase GalE [Bombilactobacillus thymidiniphilus]UQS83202.1 UDP-glucose 4-epimerase GalE [Bombilactobacillus thymidiniphilus]